jgi:hypothetical protein
MPNVAIDSDDATINAVNFTDQVADPADPATGHGLIYLKSGTWYSKIGSTVVALGGGFSNPMEAAGDIIVGGTAGAPARLAKGDDGDVLVLESGTPFWKTGGAGNTVTYSTYSTPHVNPVAGDLWIPTDGFFMYVYSGTEWLTVAQQFRTKAPPLVSTWTWVNQGSATAVDEAGTILMTSPTEAAWQWRMLTRPVPTPPYTLTACIEVEPLITSTSNSALGIGWRQAAAGGSQGYMAGFYVHCSNSVTAYNLYSAKMAGLTASQVGYANSPMANSSFDRIWLRIADDNANRICSYSLSGVNFRQFHSVTRLDYLTPDQVCLLINSGAITRTLRLLSWEVVES